MKRWLIFNACITVGILLGLGILAFRPQAHESQEALEEIPSPDYWVAFAAELLREIPGRTDGVAGKYYRASDGSSREETWPRDNPSRTIIEIRNISTSSYYLKLPSGQWEKHPMHLPGRGWNPTKMRIGTHGLASAPVVMDTVSVYRLVGSDVITFRAPALNFFPVVTVNPATGTRQRYFNFEQGEPDPMLFFPPPEAEVVESSEPMGIVTVADLEASPRWSRKPGTACGGGTDCGTGSTSDR